MKKMLSLMVAAALLSFAGCECCKSCCGCGQHPAPCGAAPCPGPYSSCPSGVSVTPGTPVPAESYAAPALP